MLKNILLKGLMLKQKPGKNPCFFDGKQAAASYSFPRAKPTGKFGEPWFSSGKDSFCISGKSLSGRKLIIRSGKGNHTDHPAWNLLKAYVSFYFLNNRPGNGKSHACAGGFGGIKRSEE